MELHVLSASQGQIDNGLAFGSADLRDQRRWKDGKLEHKLAEKYRDGGISAVASMVKLDSMGMIMPAVGSIAPDQILEPPIEQACFKIAAGLNFTLRGNGVLAAFDVTADNGCFTFVPATKYQEAMSAAGLGDHFVVNGTEVTGPADAKVVVTGSVPPHLIVWCALHDKLFHENAKIIMAQRQSSLKKLPIIGMTDTKINVEALKVWQALAGERSESFTECIITSTDWHEIRERVYVESKGKECDVLRARGLNIVLLATFPNGDRRWHEFSVGQKWDGKKYVGPLYRNGEALGCGHLIGWATAEQMKEAGFDFPSLLMSTLHKAGECDGEAHCDASAKGAAELQKGTVSTASAPTNTPEPAPASVPKKRPSLLGRMFGSKKK
jgi:hypothetical protein